jgi:hypothetical protein
MFSRPLAFVLLALGCVTAAAGGAYVATRHNGTDATTVVASAPATPSATVPATATPAQGASQPVAETEAAVSPKSDSSAASKAPETKADPAPARTPRRQDPAPGTPQATRTARNESAPSRTVPESAPARTVPESAPARTIPMTGGVRFGQSEPQAAPAQPAPASSTPEPPKPVEPQPEPPSVPQFEEVILPASSVIGLQMETSLSSERSRVEDRVDARVSRDVMAAGRVAIPAGSHVLGSVTMVDKGGKLKSPARLGIRFHTLVLTDGSEVALHTEPIYREGESPTGNSSKKIGAAAIGGAILGGILGGSKGAIIGGTTGAAGGTAAVMAGDRNPAVLAPGTIVTARLSAPATITVQRREQ